MKKDKATSDGAPTPLRASFTSVVLVCKDCERRSSGPSGFKSKQVRKVLKSAARGQRGQMRVVASTCLGPCPKKRMSVATVSSESEGVVLVGLGSLDEAEAVAESWPQR